MEKKRKKRSYKGKSWAEAHRKFGESCTKRFVLASLGVTWKARIVLRETWVKHIVLLNMALEWDSRMVERGAWVDANDPTCSCSAKPSGGVESFGKFSCIFSSLTRQLNSDFWLKMSLCNQLHPFLSFPIPLLLPSFKGLSTRRWDSCLSSSVLSAAHICKHL